ncbi:MAG TPA: ribosomal-processing cysteine protease Prp [Ruminiclostridium sp.]|jgi:uncharacterized protein YsxB (DUF464 family)|nr:ribosomal-processing cysteine protease Prp [Clostridiaceae bacterium]HAA26102.1 ribosomal-processing cysteine protease Prp [Ruminiclostridium sp.]
MIIAEFYRDNDGKIRGFKVRGHAGYDSSGKDIVCSAVSAVVYTALGGMIELAGFRNFEEKDREYISCFIPDNLTAEQLITADIILRTMVIGLKQIEAEYGQYIRIRYKEV